MKIEMNKKYKTKNGQDVRIYATDGIGEYPVHGAIFDGRGFYSCEWFKDGSLYIDSESDFDLVEAREDWEILVEYFENNNGIIAVNHNLSIFICTGVIDTDKHDILLLNLLFDDELIHRVSVRKSEVSLAKLEDCKKYILGR